MDNAADYGMTRRGFLAAALSGLANISMGFGQNEKWDVSYIWHPSIDGVLDYMEGVSRVLGPEVSKDLRVVKGRKNYGLIYERDGDSESTARAVAERHSALLRYAGLVDGDDTGAYAIRHEGYDFLWNVTYGKGPNLEDLTERFAEVYKTLGPMLGQDLVIEETRDGEFALVYKRRGDRESTTRAAFSHADTLERHSRLRDRPLASIRMESGSRVVYGESSFLDSDIGPALRRDYKEPPEAREPSVPGIDSNLEADIERFVKDLRQRGRVESDEETSWSVYCFTDGTKLATINEDAPRQCASMVKPLVGLAFLHQVGRGRFVYGPRSRSRMEAMIQRSDNGATNWLMNQLGGPAAVHDLLQENYGGILPQTEIVEYIPSGGRTYRNRASAHDYSRFLFGVWNDNVPRADEMRRLLALPNRDRVYTGAREVPEGTLVYNKTGSTARLCGDIAILAARGKDGKRYPYTLIGIIEKSRRTSNYGIWKASRGNVIREVSNITYRFMKERHDLL